MTVKKLVFAPLLMIPVIFLTLGGCSGRVVAQGEKVGSVIKVSEQGFWVKTSEGELVRGGMNNGSGGFSTTPLHFTINDAGLKEKVQDALDGQYEVKVRYTEYFCLTSYTSESNCLFLTGIEKLEH